MAYIDPSFDHVTRNPPVWVPSRPVPSGLVVRHRRRDTSTGALGRDRPQRGLLERQTGFSPWGQAPRSSQDKTE